MVLPRLALITVLLATACTTKIGKPKLSLDSDSGTDFHMHIHSPAEDDDDLQFTGDRALLAADSIGLKRAVLLPNGYSKNGCESCAIKENDYVESEVAKNPTQLAGACAVNPMKDWAKKEVKRCAKLGVKLLKLHLLASGMDLKKEADYKMAEDVLKTAELHNMTVIVHASYHSSRGDEILDLKKLIEAFPKTRWILGHLFGRDFEVLKSIKHRNFYVEVSVTPIMLRTHQDRKTLMETIRAVGIGKFIFGSDWPVFHPTETLKALKSLPLTNEEIEAITFKNASQLNDLFQKD